MTKHLTKFKIKPNLQIIYPIILVLTTLYLSYVNYTPNTFLTGWDTLHPEFNFSEYFNRILNGAWQTHQGLGAVNTQAHASEIPRIVILYIISLLFKLPDIRYIYSFLMLIIGPLGVYYFTKQVLLNNFKHNSKELGSFLAGLFYLLNIGTLQHFYVPLEMFLTHYALLGWSFLYATKAYQEPNKKNYLSFIFVSILMTSQAHTPTLFYTYFLAKILYFFGLSIDLKLKKITQNIKRSFLVLSTILLMNSFWILPSFYFLITKSTEIKESKIHHLFSDEAFFANASFGYLKDVSLIRGFLFDWGEYTGQGRFGPLLNVWVNHFEKYNLQILGYIYFILILFGVLISLVNKNKYTFGLLLVMSSSIIFLLSINPPFGFFIKFLLDKLPLLKEILRFPFTKFSIFLMFTYAVFFGAFFGYIFEKIKNQRANFYLNILVFTVISTSLVFYMLPAFKGNLISPSMRVEIPKRYFEMFDYLDSQKSYGRVANLPVHSFWGWVYYNWNPETGLGYQGAGFLWFGIKQPLLDREFDRWNIKNEQFYREISYSIYQKDVETVEKILEKYKVRWLLLDKSVIAPGYDSSVLFFDEITEMFSRSSKFSLVKNFEDDLLLYEYIPDKEFSLIEVIDSYTKVGRPFFRDYTDFYYNQFGDYVYGQNNQDSLIGKTTVNESIDDENITSTDDRVFIDFKSNNYELFNIGYSYLDRFSDSNIFEINDQVFDYKSISNFLISDTSATIQVYEKNAVEEVTLPFSVTDCGYVGKDSYFSLEKINNSFLVSTKSVRSCLNANLGVLDSLLQRKSNLFYLSIKSVPPKNVCIYDLNNGLCKNVSVNNGIYAYLDKPLNYYNINLTFEPSSSVFPQTTLLNNISLGWLDLLDKKSLTEVSKIYSDIYFSLSKDLNNSGNLIDLNNYPILCDPKFKDLGDSIVEYSGKSITYFSPQESICDRFNFYTLNQNQGYLLEIKSKNITGEPIRVCLSDINSQRCNANFSLPKNQNLKSNYFILPPFGHNKGYTLSFTNLVFGNFEAKNEVEYVSFVPFDYKKTMASNITADFENKKIFVLNQSYDPGWVAICGYKLCNASHVVVNNWANGWVFDQNTVDYAVPKNVKIVFWPQYLQYLGYFLALIPFIVIFKIKVSGTNNINKK